MNFRHAEILDLARRHGKVTVEQLAETFDVTLQTIRRDLSDLAEQGRLSRVHGGAVLPSGISNLGYEDRRRLNDEAKSRIGANCATLIKNNSSVFIGIGTTCEAVARSLIHHDGLLVMTNNLNAVPLLSANPNCKILVTGGALRSADAGLVGPQAVKSAQMFRFDMAVIGCSALDQKGDLFDYDVDEVIVSQELIKNSRSTVLVADASKFERNAPARIASLNDLGEVVTDHWPADLLPRDNDATPTIHIV